MALLDRSEDAVQTSAPYRGHEEDRFTQIRRLSRGQDVFTHLRMCQLTRRLIGGCDDRNLVESQIVRVHRPLQAYTGFLVEGTEPSWARLCRFIGLSGNKMGFCVCGSLGRNCGFF